MMIFIWILLIVVLYYAFDHKKYNTTQIPETSAAETLKMRFAKGEISEETFEKMKKTIF